VLFDFGIEVTGRTRVLELLHRGKQVKGLQTLKVVLPKGKKFHPREMADDKKSEPQTRYFDTVIMAVGSRSSAKVIKHKQIFYAGDMVNGPTTVVEAVAAGKNTAAQADAAIQKTPKPKIPKNTKSRVYLQGRNLTPVSLETDFFGRKIISPYLLSAAPPSDGYEQMKKAYEAGWAGGVMKTTFDNVPIHIPGEYMFAFTQDTYANCDNVSGHPMDRVCKEVGKLVKEYPDRLTIVSTGGPVTGDDTADKHGWQSNTKKLENAGVMGVEYSLSCPQGGDGTKGDIVSQDAELTAKIIDWVMEISDPNIPKLFKLTAAVTAIYPILKAIQDVLNKYPNKKAGVTLANTFPTLAFRKGEKSNWDEGIVVGMSGEGVIPISNLTLANAARFNMFISGNGGPMDYKAAANFLALGVKNVQFCTIVMKYGYGIIDDLHSGLSHLMAARGYKSVNELIGCALPDPITGFMELTPVKQISDVNRDLCQHCGNCTRCPYLAIELDKKLTPVTDPSKCIGCSICTQKCFSGALFMRDRTKEEAAMLCEE
jgi:dihydropyrimidine dehydrogenase (NAD+) subunit PreA